MSIGAITYTSGNKTEIKYYDMMSGRDRDMRETEHSLQSYWSLWSFTIHSNEFALLIH